jgi:hypothetical protein
MPFSASDLERYLSALGDELALAGAGARVIVVGGAALILRGLTDRTTYDIDVLAVVASGELVTPVPLAPELAGASSA